jgi:glycosyltransferase involved in cell wall biosynthesis
VAHVHSHHHFSASTLNALAARNVPIVWTAHDYHAICPVGTLFTEGAVCDRCQGRRFHQAARHRCAQTGLTGSLLSAADSAWLNWSGALGRVSHFIDKWSPVAMPSNGPITFIGRLYRQKGVHVLLMALSKLKLPASQRVVIAGDGPEMAALRQQAAALGLERVEFTGALDDTAVRQLLVSSRLIVAPSIWYEVLGIVILEAYAIGRPVIASHIGGIPEVISQGDTGLLCNPGDADDLAGQIDWMLSHPAQTTAMGSAARRRAETHFAPDDHLQRLIEIYAAAIQQR